MPIIIQQDDNNITIVESGSVVGQVPTPAVPTVEAQGPQGPKGDKGDPGSSAAFYFEYVQSSPASSWNIIHGLGKYPNVEFIDSSGNVGIADIEQVDVNTVHLTFPNPTTGTVICS